MPTRGPIAVLLRSPATMAVAVALIGAYGAQLAVGGGQDGAVRLGALRADRVMEHHELYRLVLATWLHDGPVHLGVNLLAFLQLGSLVEYVWGGLRMAVVFAATGLVATVAAAAFGAYGFPTYGASGGVLGLAGLLMASRWVGDPSLRLFLQDALGRRLSIAVATTFVVGLMLELGFPDVVSGWGHVGGFVSGGILAFSVSDPRAGRELFRLLGGLGAVGLTGSMLAVAVQGGAAMETHDEDMARLLLARASAQPDSYRAAFDLVPMLDHYTEAGTPERGLQRFTEQVEQLQNPRLVRLVVGRLYLDAEVEERDRPEALAVALERWLAFEPHDPQVLNAVAWHLITRPDEEARDPVRAVELASKALRRIPSSPPRPWYVRGLELVSGPDPGAPRPMRASVLDTMAEALHQAGRVDEALEAQRESVAIATELQMEELEAMQERLARIEEDAG